MAEHIKISRGEVAGPVPSTGEADAAAVEEWVRVAARAATTKSDAEVVALQVGEVLGICDWFVICSGSNPRQVRTLCEEIEKVVVEAGGPAPRRVEGRDHLQWVLMDYGDFVVHVFHDEARAFYELERLWSDVPRLDWQAVENL